MDQNPYESPREAKLPPPPDNRLWWQQPFHPMTLAILVAIAAFLVLGIAISELRH
jgi:hypothetical protein